ncbi:MAG: hypothetical protein OZ927_16910 [Alcaligenaceae bacterium]|nr:hypothetical protein [Alcaligenaceae bacterium]
MKESSAALRPRLLLSGVFGFGQRDERIDRVQDFSGKRGVVHSEVMLPENAPNQWDELVDSRKAFDGVRPFDWQDAEAAYAKDESLAHEAGSGKVNRAIRALQLETEIRTSPERRADRFVERFRDLKQTGERQYAAGNYSGYRSARADMGNMAMSLERDPQLESLLANRKRELGISFDSGRSLGRELAFTHGIDLGRGRGLGL